MLFGEYRGAGQKAEGREPEAVSPHQKRTPDQSSPYQAGLLFSSLERLLPTDGD